MDQPIRAVSSGLRLITKNFDFQVVSLMVIAALVTIPVSQSLAYLIGEANWHLIIFPIGQTFFNGLAGYWWVRADSGETELAPREESVLPTAHVDHSAT